MTTKSTLMINRTTLKSNYWLKLELIAFCQKNKIYAGGSKQDLEQRIETFFISGASGKPEVRKQQGKRDSSQPLTPSTMVVNYKNDTATRIFFISHIGPHFHFNIYLRQFTDPNKITKNLTYGDLIDGWIREESKKNNPSFQTEIGEQFEYNRFIRDYFSDKEGNNRSEAIKAWQMVKTLKGPKTYAHYKFSLETIKVCKS